MTDKHPRCAASRPPWVLPFHDFFQLAEKTLIASEVSRLPPTQDVCTLATQSVTLVLPIIFTVFALLYAGICIFELVFYQTLLIQPVLMM